MNLVSVKLVVATLGIVVIVGAAERPNSELLIGDGHG
jgi:hypothetical protein